MVKHSPAHGMVGVKSPKKNDDAPDEEGEKRPHEFFPTPHNVTWAMLQFFKLSKNLKVYDPCSGEGDMVLPLKAYGFSEIFASDLREGDEIVGEQRVDFLMGGYNPPADIVIANPPFSLSVGFIERAIWKYPAVCMLLKGTYWHAQGRVDLFDKHPPSHMLPIAWRPDFSFKDVVPKDRPMLDVMWVCWNMSGHNTSTVYQPLRKPDDVGPSEFLGIYNTPNDMLKI